VSRAYPNVCLVDVQLRARAEKRALVYTVANAYEPLDSYVAPHPRGLHDIWYIAWPWSYDNANGEAMTLALDEARAGR
jgi:hypothetical protein